MLRSRGAKIETPVFISKCRINGSAANLRISRGSFIGRVTLHLHDRIEIGRNVVINDGALLLTASHDTNSVTFAGIKAPIGLSDFAWVASNAILLPGATIGSGAVVGAGAVIKNTVPAYKIAVGAPARLLERERPHDLGYEPVRLVAAVEAWLGPAERTHD
jgi:maltose O-acetyltransferase